MGEIISAQQLRAASKGKVNESNMNSVLVALNQYGPMFTYVDDDPHQGGGVNYSVIGESHAAWIACNMAGV